MWIWNELQIKIFGFSISQFIKAHYNVFIAVPKKTNVLPSSCWRALILIYKYIRYTAYKCNAILYRMGSHERLKSLSDFLLNQHTNNLTPFFDDGCWKLKKFVYALQWVNISTSHRDLNKRIAHNIIQQMANRQQEISFSFNYSRSWHPSSPSSYNISSSQWPQWKICVQIEFLRCTDRCENRQCNRLFCV